MVIDKSTGKGCAWSIASKTVARRLIADGIIDKPIFRKPRSNYVSVLTVGYSDNQAYVISPGGDKLAGEPLWTPSFIDPGIWEQAVSRFRIYDRLDRNVEKYLLPKMDEYLQSIPDAELASMIRDFLIEHNVINKPICQRAGKTYYFSENEVYSVDEKLELFPYEKRIKYSLFSPLLETCFNMRVWRKAVSQFEVGMTLKECSIIFLKTELIHGIPKINSPVDQLVQSIATPIYERVPENMNKATFDYIRITVGLPRYQFDSWEKLQDEVEKYQQEIYQRVILTVKNDRQFKRYGVPINFLKLSDVTLLHDFSMEFIFELKGQIDPLLDNEN